MFVRKIEKTEIKTGLYKTRKERTEKSDRDSDSDGE
jgi:hypothetical protein